MDFIVFGGVLFWILVGLDLLALALFIRVEKAVAAFMTLAAWFVVIFFFCDTGFSTMFSWLTWPRFFVGLLAYLVIGVLWSMFKWYKLCRRRMKYMKEQKNEFIKDYNENRNYQNSEEEVKLAWIKYRKDHRIYDYEIPKVSRHKSEITTWMSFWPFSVFWFIAEDLIVKLYENIYEAISGVYKKIAKRVFKDFLDEVDHDF